MTPSTFEIAGEKKTGKMKKKGEKKKTSNLESAEAISEQEIPRL
jgi:hypothetical protein